MDITYYTFAFFVFILLSVLIWFYGRVTRKKADPGSAEKEQRLFRLYQNIEDMMGSFEEYAESAKKEIDEGLEKLKAIAGETKSVTVQPLPFKQPELVPRPEKTAALPDESRLRTEDRISLLMQRGLSKGEIAKELGLSIREVSLIMDIKKITFPDNLT
jgi:hypothetical protein